MALLNLLDPVFGQIRTAADDIFDRLLRDASEGAVVRVLSPLPDGQGNIYEGRTLGSTFGSCLDLLHREFAGFSGERGSLLGRDRIDGIGEGGGDVSLFFVDEEFHHEPRAAHVDHEDANLLVLINIVGEKKPGGFWGFWLV